MRCFVLLLLLVASLGPSARAAARIRAGRTSDTPIHTADVMPTLAELADATRALPSGIDGLSLVPELLGPASLPRDRVLYWEWNGAHFAPKYEPKFQAARRGDWKILRHQLGGTWELYHLAKDAAETHNLAEKNPSVVASLANWIEQHREPHLPQLEPPKPPGRRWR